jgi:hypothetical protein
MEGSETTSDSKVAPSSDSHIPGYVDWIVSLVIAIGGLGLTILGTVLVFVLDRDLLAEGIESGQITVGIVERDLTRAEMLEFTLEVLNWTGIGLLVTGTGLVVFAIGYGVARRRTRTRHGVDVYPGTVRSYAVTGATASAVLSFIPFSALVGGGLAGYFGRQETGRSTSVGAFAGLLYTVPGIVIVLFVTVGLFFGLSAVAEAGLGVVLIAIMAFVMLLITAYGVGLGALGGFIGGRLAEE